MKLSKMPKLPKIAEIGRLISIRFCFSDDGDDRGPQIGPFLPGWGGMTRDDGDFGDLLPGFALLALPVLLCLSHLQDEI
jgi:hypothetical protein